ncbi:MAG: tRNA modification GTPase [Phycisphaerae bacterium]
MFDVIDDTIVAVSSPPGSGPRGIVRCSGPETMALVQRIFAPQSGAKIDTVPGFRRLDGEVELEPGCAVPGEMYLFRAPRSYTRQDCVEFHVPGSPALLAMLVQRLIELGARAAQPGEFSARAFLSGAMDLTKVEAVAALIRSRSDAQLRAARRMMDGRLAETTDRILQQLAQLVALVEADIDFAQEPIEFITPADLKLRLHAIADALRRLIGSAQSTERIDVLPHILLIGRPNAGKSTLMNRLGGMDRSICAPAPGTTRDVLSAPIALDHGEALLLDAAGVDPAAEGLMHKAGKATLETAARVDLLCLVVDLSTYPDNSVLELTASVVGTPCVVVGNKMDLIDDTDRDARIAWLKSAGRGPVCAISAKTGQGVDRCRQLLAEVLHLPETGVGDDVVLITARQCEATETALAAVERCATEASAIGETIDRADILAFELREALESLGTIAGTVTTEDLLSRVFASFCIGK